MIAVASRAPFEATLASVTDLLLHLSSTLGIGDRADEGVWTAWPRRGNAFDSRHWRATCAVHSPSTIPLTRLVAVKPSISAPPATGFVTGQVRLGFIRDVHRQIPSDVTAAWHWRSGDEGFCGSVAP
jgi:hypothetical protein